MTTTEDFVSVSDLTLTEKDPGISLIYLSDKDPSELMRKYQEIRMGKDIVSAYGMNGRHYLVVFVDAKIKVTKKVTKKTRRK